MIIIIAEIQGHNVIENVTCEFNTEYLTEAHKMLTDKYEGYEIEIVYVFDSTLNLIERMNLLIKQTKENEKT